MDRPFESNRPRRMIQDIRVNPSRYRAADMHMSPNARIGDLAERYAREHGEKVANRAKEIIRSAPPVVPRGTLLRFNLPASPREDLAVFWQSLKAKFQRLAAGEAEFTLAPETKRDLKRALPAIIALGILLLLVLLKPGAPPQPAVPHTAGSTTTGTVQLPKPAGSTNSGRPAAGSPITAGSGASSDISNAASNTTADTSGGTTDSSGVSGSTIVPPSTGSTGGRGAGGGTSSGGIPGVTQPYTVQLPGLSPSADGKQLLSVPSTTITLN